MKIHFIIYLSIFMFLLNNTQAQPNYPGNPYEAKIISSDLKNFIEAYKSLSAESDSLYVLKEMYFDRASAGMKEFISKHDLTKESVLKAMQMHPETYSGLEKFYNDLSVFESDYIKELEAFKSVMPDAIFPPAILLVGDYRGIAQASRLGQLITVETGTKDPDNLLTVMIHELTHFQQAMKMGVEKYTGVYSKNDNMLDLILREGVAEFVTYKLVRNNEDKFTRLKKYEENENELWEKFNTDLKDQNSGFWLSFTIEDINNGIPILPGYAVGYKIVESYYDQNTDKSAALEELLNISDAQAFFIKSNYKPAK
ncbi:MAG TPA: DUF2268 domain-containing putative Zn-dependent protease [Ignavibacteria bacterium]|nr:DUF2268 domain-containing putative Zn-dependent protease [Ignavibacteria bacterium]